MLRQDKLNLASNKALLTYFTSFQYAHEILNTQYVHSVSGTYSVPEQLRCTQMPAVQGNMDVDGHTRSEVNAR